MVLKLFLFAILLLFSAFFVATEFAVVRLRTSRVNQMVNEGAKNAKSVEKVITHLDGYLSACQLGITITALGLGWLGEPTVHELLHPLFERLHLQANLSNALSFIISFVIVTYLHVVLGELAPKTLAIIKAEQVSQFTSPIIIWFNKLMFPFIWLLNGSANGLVRMLGLKPTGEHEAHSEEEIRLIMSESYESGKINKSELSYVNRIFEFDERLAREIMVPRTDMVCLFVEKSKEENIAIIRKEQYTRFPVASGSKDNIIGVINTKQFFMHDFDTHNSTVRSLMQPMMSVPEVIPIKKLLRRMQLERVHIAILLDEYGGTSGMITIEDIVEEIVGEIRDEFDEDEVVEIDQIGDNVFLVDGKALISEVNEATGSHLESQDVDSIGGWLFNQNAELKVGEPWTYAELTFTVRVKEKHRIRKVEIMVNRNK
ncbi:hemolysin family protein [Paenibacillus radicis (ex Gao et al. 2016)]|uniref:Membrane protein n=1 Tax=Paenibacillus radicis (ex Gao et al. 2016) TaxID=1737354 RepID=A0A917M7F2_9BACL|nr:hemolysin family protein [Paenibacillus radicis (ex Gao et al. 2016)]GGG79819.1 membrane protein [Paenibacillus radicis (ex Gao et al. 2016)]